MKEEYSRQEQVVSCLKKQVHFVEGMVRSRQELDMNILAPLPNEGEPENDILTVQARCIACGLLVEDKTATLLVHLQPCNHTYHLLCFQYAYRIATTRLTKGNCWASQHSSLCFINNSNDDSFASSLKSIPTIHPIYQTGSPSERMTWIRRMVSFFTHRKSD